MDENESRGYQIETVCLHFSGLAYQPIQQDIEWDFSYYVRISAKALT